jgi:hypothetical protein
MTRTISSVRLGVLAVMTTAGIACKPDLGAPISLVQGPRILAVRGEPPEAKEMATVAYDLLAVDAGGTLPSPPAFWAVCKAPRPPSETNAVSGACLTIPDDAGPAPTFSGAITSADPNDQTSSGACSTFGPLRPPSDPNARPRDPDVTGGFYQPVRVRLDGSDGAPALFDFDLERIQCRLGNAPIDVANQYNNGYQPNRNPLLAQLTLAIDGGAPAPIAPVIVGAPPPAATALPAGATLTLEASWAAEAAETFPVYDLQSVALVTHREALRVSWFATAGAFAHDVTGRAEDDLALATDNDWTAPTAPGPVHLWLVLRDSRGGIDFQEFALDVTP